MGFFLFCCYSKHHGTFVENYVEALKRLEQSWYHHVSDHSGSIFGMGSGIVVVTVAGIVTGDALVSYWADLATERERHLTTGKRAERTKLDFRCPICHYAFCKASCLNSTRRRQLTFRSVAKGA